jgi:hypothetical protein
MLNKYVAAKMGQRMCQHYYVAKLEMVRRCCSVALETSAVCWRWVRKLGVKQPVPLVWDPIVWLMSSTDTKLEDSGSEVQIYCLYCNQHPSRWIPPHWREQVVQSKWWYVHYEWEVPDALAMRKHRYAAFDCPVITIPSWSESVMTRVIKADCWALFYNNDSTAGCGSYAHSWRILWSQADKTWTFRYLFSQFISVPVSLITPNGVSLSEVVGWTVDGCHDELRIRL